jgi:nucleoid-associated protein YgaU
MIQRSRKPDARAATIAVGALVFGAAAYAMWWSIDHSPPRVDPAETRSETPEDDLADVSRVRATAARLAAPRLPDSPPASVESMEKPVAPAARSRLEQAKAAGITVRVKHGETLIDLAADHLGSPDRWRELLEVNADQISKPEQLRADMLLRLPEGVVPATPEQIRVSRFLRSIKGLQFDLYEVHAGDTLASIASKRYGDQSQSGRIVDANRDTFAAPPPVEAPLTAGQRLRLPKDYVPGTCSGG